MLTQFLIPATGQPVRLRATGSLQVRCVDPALLVAQFVGLPFDLVNDGVLRSVSRSVERMLGRLLTRRVVMAGTPNAVTDPQMLAGIIEELVAYNPAAGAVFGVELVRVGHVTVVADDGSRPWQQMLPSASGSNPRINANGEPNLLETARGMPPLKNPASSPPPVTQRPQHQQPIEASGEIVVHVKAERSEKTTAPGHAAASSPGLAAAVPDPHRVITTPVPQRGALDVPASREEETLPELDPSRRRPASVVATGSSPGDSRPTPPEPRGAILGIGMSPIGSTPTPAPAATSDLPLKIAPGGRVLVPGPNGLMQSATVRQLLQGYYELEVGGSGETIWVPVNGVVPE